ncbi:hypothetical protein [Treponema endosymbiont of Eucomonympha sp.]|uniref:hypothetical protein n=1 Tax=Treponema endosymbiont of Eucomonympha sp. TaxID=1580831 RepID=UPI00164EEC56|nr:hypothetical protein [Treponema endosymbiont of Eucomonympha sp.]
MLRREIPGALRLVDVFDDVPPAANAVLRYGARRGLPAHERAPLSNARQCGLDRGKEVK